MGQVEYFLLELNNSDRFAQNGSCHPVGRLKEDLKPFRPTVVTSDS